MPSNSYILPTPGTGFDRSSCLTTFAASVSGASGLGYLANATYEVDDQGTEGIWTFNQATLATTPSTSGRYIDACTDNVSGFYVLGDTGPLIHVSSITGSPSSIALSTSGSSLAYTGLTYNTSDGKPYFIGSDGTLYNITGGVQTTVSAPPGGVSAPARWLYSDSSGHLYTIFPSSNLLSKYTIGTGWSSTLSPFTNSLDAVSYSASVSAAIIGGTNTTQLTDNSTILDITYALTPTQLLICDSSDSILVYTLTDGGFRFAQDVEGYSGVPVQIAAEPDGIQCLVTDTVNNQIEILTYSGVWAETGLAVGTNTPIVGPSSIAIYTNTSGLTQALVCQSNNTVNILNKSFNNWASVQGLTIAAGTNQVAVTGNGTPSAIVATSTGVQFLTFNGADWSLTTSITLNPVPTLVAAEASSTTNTYLYAAGTSGGVTTVYIFSNGIQVGSYTVSGTVAGLEVIDSQILVAMTNGNLNVGYYIQGVTSNTLNSATLPAGSTVNMAWIPSTPEFFPTLAVAGPNIIYTYYNNFPQTFVRETDSSIAVLISGGAFTTKVGTQYTHQPLRTNSAGVSGQWTILDLIDRNKVSSITTDASKNIYAVTVGNDIYKFNSTGSLVNNYPFVITPPTNQEEFVPLGLSKLVFWNSQLWAASSLLGGLVQIIP